MGRPFIVLGDKTDHGGTVITGASTSVTGSKPIARIGDTVTCPRPDCVVRGMGTNQIVSGDQTIIVDDKPVARHGDKTACGATLISSQVPTTAGGPGSSSAAKAADLSQMSGAEAAQLSDAETFNELPTNAQEHVAMKALEAGVFDSPGPGLGSADPDKYSTHSAAKHGQVFSTRDPETFDRLARSQMGLSFGAGISPNNILNTDPNAPDMRATAGAPGSTLKQVSQIDLHDSLGATAARVADGRAEASVSDMDGGAPQAKPGYGKQLAAVSGLGAVGNTIKSVQDAQHLGLRSQAKIYEDTRNHRRYLYLQDYKENIQGTDLEGVGVSRQMAASRLDRLANDESDMQESIDRKNLNEFYQQHFWNK